MLEERLTAIAASGATAVLWSLVLMSVLCVAIAVERVLQRMFDRSDAALLQAVGASGERIDPALMVNLKTAEGTVGRILGAGVRAGELGGPPAAEEAIAGAMVRERSRLQRGLLAIGTVGANAPFVGLFGTVLGIVRAFSDLAANTDDGGAAVMAGISEALVATAVGLLVAIPAVVLYNALSRWNDAVLERAEHLAHRVVLQFRLPKTAEADAALRETA